MRALVIYCHPKPQSYTAAVRDVVLDQLERAGAEVELLDLYAMKFDPVLSAEGMDCYLDEFCNAHAVEAHAAAVQRCDTLIFVYPTWWYGLPAMLKGWLDRVLLPGIAFKMPQGPGDVIRPGLGNIERLGVFTTCGASWWLTRIIGAPGKRMLMRGVGYLCPRRCRKVYAAHYLMDSSTDESRARHLARVERKMESLLAGVAKPREVTA